LAGTTFDVYFYNVGVNDTAAPFLGDGTIADSAQSDYVAGGASPVFSGNYLNDPTPTEYGSAPLVISIAAVPEPTTFTCVVVLGSSFLLRRRSRNRD
jgi:hypothetical protein